MNFMNNMPVGDEIVNVRKYDPSAYSSFGNQADYAYDQGWMPIESSSNGATIFRNRYSPAFKNVLIGNKPIGELQIVGNKNGLFDVVIRNGETGEVENTIMKGQPFDEIDNYFRRNDNVINQRTERAKKAPESSKYNGISWNQ